MLLIFEREKCFIITYVSESTSFWLYLQVSVDKVLKTLKENANKATSLLLTAIPQIGSMDWTETQHNLKVWWY